MHVSRLTIAVCALAAMAAISACSTLDRPTLNIPVPVDSSDLPQGETTFTNMEEVYFESEQGTASGPWLGLVISGDSPRAIDAFGAPAVLPADFAMLSRNADRLTVTASGRTTELRLARPVTCWAVVSKGELPDGSTDWHGGGNLAMFDQGGRLSIGGGDSGAPETILRMRRVTWPQGSSNRASLVLYVHSPEAPDTAMSYSWADGDAKFVGINLRWMQASCTINPD